MTLSQHPYADVAPKFLRLQVKLFWRDKENCFSINLTIRIGVKSKKYHTMLKPMDKMAVFLTWALSNTIALKLGLFFSVTTLKNSYLAWKWQLVHIPNALISKNRFPVKNVSQTSSALSVSNDRYSMLTLINLFSSLSNYLPTPYQVSKVDTYWMFQIVGIKWYIWWPEVGQVIQGCQKVICVCANGSKE